MQKEMTINMMAGITATNKKKELFLHNKKNTLLNKEGVYVIKYKL